MSKVGNEYALSFLNNKYYLIDKIGMGTFSSVWLALNIIDCKLYAIKIQNIEYYSDGKKEAKYLRKINELNCPHLTKLVDWFETDNPKAKYVNYCMVLELCKGTVSGLLKSSDKPFSVDLSFRVAKHVVLAVDALNSINMIHTDIKLSNVLIGGLNPLFEEFQRYLEGINFVETYREKYARVYEVVNAMKKNKHTKTDMFEKQEKRSERDFKILKNETAKFLMTEFKKLCNTKCAQTEEPADFFTPSYYKKHFDFKYDLDDAVFVLSDYGTVHKYDERKTSVIQTRNYRAPEVILNQGWDNLADIWSIGCILFEMTTAYRLFDPEKDMSESYSDSDDDEELKDRLDKLHMKSINKLINSDDKRRTGLDAFVALTRKYTENLDDEDVMKIATFLFSTICELKNRKDCATLISSFFV